MIKLQKLHIEDENCILKTPTDSKQGERLKTSISMSFLLEDDAHATLQVALAFIDACDDSSSTSSTSSSTGSSQMYRKDDDVNKTMDAITSLDASSHRPTAPRQSTRTKQSDAVMRSRAKKKTEALLLREQVTELEATLRGLQHARRAGSSRIEMRDGDGDYNDMLLAKVMSKAEASLWVETVTMQARERQQAQLLNTKLKDAVEKQGKAVKALEATLRRLTGQFVRCLYSLSLYLLACGLL